jgi:hypothetical protein
MSWPIRFVGVVAGRGPGAVRCRCGWVSLMVLIRRIGWFVATLIYHVVEAVVAIGAGSAASSVVLIGFGLTR